MKDEVVSRTIASLTFSPDTASAVCSMKKIRRELTGWDANGHTEEVKKMQEWEDSNSFMRYAKRYIMNYDLNYDSGDDYRRGKYVFTNVFEVLCS